MSVKKQIPSVCILYSLDGESPEDYYDETDVESYFYRNIFYMSQSQHQIVRMSTGSNRTSIAIKLFQFLRFKDPATIYPSRRSDYLQKRTEFFGR